MYFHYNLSQHVGKTEGYSPTEHHCYLTVIENPNYPGYLNAAAFFNMSE